MENDEEKYFKQYGYWSSNPQANGELYLSFFLDTLICQSFYNPFIEEIVNQFILGSSNSTSFQQKLYNKYGLAECSLFLYRLPKDIQILELYGKVFEELLKYKMILIGVFKRIGDNLKPIVLIHPPMDLKIGCNDRVFVLCKSDPSSTYHEVSDLELIESSSKSLLERLQNKGSFVLSNISTHPLDPIIEELHLLREKIVKLNAES